MATNRNTALMEQNNKHFNFEPQKNNKKFQKPLALETYV